MLPPVLEIYVVWHPSDVAGLEIANEIIAQYRGTAFTGLIGGAVEVFVRSEGWCGPLDAPRAIPFLGAPLAANVQQAYYTAIVPILGLGLAASVEEGGPWREYISTLVASQAANPSRSGIFPFRLDDASTQGTILGADVNTYQTIAAASVDAPHDSHRNLRCRDLSQAIAQAIGGTGRITAFISHTKRATADEPGNVNDLVALVRNVVAATHLAEFFDARDLQPGSDWADALIQNAGSSALLCLRTDLYPSREWCQREVVTAKRHGMPIVTLDALGRAEERGSFLMDHVPRVPVRYGEDGWKRGDIYVALNLLVDECLKRVLWNVQRSLAAGRGDLNVNWWAPHAPEPVTLAQWLENARLNNSLPKNEEMLRILHPDPPLGPDERAVLEQMLAFGGLPDRLDVMTPRQLAARGG